MPTATRSKKSDVPTLPIADRTLTNLTQVFKLLADESRLRRMLSNADRTAGAWDGERLVGFARALCDEAFNGYIGTVCVHPDYQRQYFMRKSGIRSGS